MRGGEGVSHNTHGLCRPSVVEIIVNGVLVALGFGLLYALCCWV